MGQGASQSSHSGWRILKVHARGPCGSGDLVRI